MLVKYTVRNIPGMRNYIAVFSFLEYEKTIVEPRCIRARSYEDAMNIASDMFFNTPSKLEALIELDIVSEEDKNSNDLGSSVLAKDLIKEKRKDLVKTYSDYQEAIKKLKSQPIPEPKPQSVNSMTYYDAAKKEEVFKLCPFRFNNYGQFCRCEGCHCIAYMVNPEDCLHYCARLKKGE